MLTVGLRESPDRQFATAASVEAKGPGVAKGPLVVDTTFPKGKALADCGGALPDHPRIVTINTPVGLPAEEPCGRAAHLEAHISQQPSFIPVGPTTAFPGVCGTKLNKGEEALAFLFFVLAACIQDDQKPVVPPIVIP